MARLRLSNDTCSSVKEVYMPESSQEVQRMYIWHKRFSVEDALHKVQLGKHGRLVASYRGI